MKAIKSILILVLIISTGNVFAQQFVTGAEIFLPDSIVQAHHECADLDNDGLPDILLLATTQTNRHYALFMKGDTLHTPHVLDTVVSIISPDAYLLADYDRDNQIDIIVSETDAPDAKVVVYLNKGNFTFNEQPLAIPAFKTLRLADLDNDGVVEWIVSGRDNAAPYMRILKETIPGTWTLMYDDLEVETTALEILDADRDGTLDLFVSGSLTADSLFTGFLINHNDFFFSPADTISWAGTASRSDFNADGIPDITFTGLDKKGNNISKRFESTPSGYMLSDTPFMLQDGIVFTADLNADGAPDLSYFGPASAGDTVNIIAYGPQDYDTLAHHKVISQRFVDLEHDGDLDLVQLVATDPMVVRVFQNNPIKKNDAPAKPAKSIALNFFNRHFLYWDKSYDDNTPAASITYDLFVFADAVPLQVGEYDLLLDKRLTVTPGNNGTSNFRLLKNDTVPTMQFAVQAVDNALHAGMPCLGGGLQGSGLCARIDTEGLSVCASEPVYLQAREPALWFSFSKGYLGTAQAFNFQFTKPDTVFYFDPAHQDCMVLKAWTISINNDTTKTEGATLYGCKDATLSLGVAPGWQNIRWNSLLNGPLGTTDSIQYQVTRPDSVFVIMSNGLGCTVLRKTAIAISAPVVHIEPDAYKIMKGQAVTLQASGAQRYQWSPPDGLEHTDVPAPVATPLTTTTYTVTGYDSLGCSATATVLVSVETAAFVPTLFSPNNDGNNDRLKIYGLANPDSFAFSVFNRQGNLVFKTNSVTEISQNGWDGTTNGVRQPGGVYYWEVNGTAAPGSNLLLNGKKSGFFVLIR